MEVLNPRSVLVTGSNRGIGLELVKQLVEKSDPPEWIFATCRDPEGPRAKSLKNLAAQHQHRVEIIQLDTSDPSSIKAAAAKITECLHGAGLNLLFNNAGIVKSSSLESETPENMLEVYNTNVVGPMVMGQAALNMLNRCQSLQYAQDEILCVALHPGWLQTDMGSGNETLRAPTTVEDGVQEILKTLAQLSEKETGTFVNLDGKLLPW
ncbi:uncharacterized protein [Pituophis catenifer annectens]|uniref:uncharacterized protein isoform X2 n=1 Tax=Pituophis catenifer annectens TaxID=94852 RepID=UPI00399491E8